MGMHRCITLTILLLASACSSSGSAPSHDSGGIAGMGGKSGSSSDGGAGPTGLGVGGGTLHSGPKFAGAECPSDLGFPDAYALGNVQALVSGSTARITFDPTGDAKDYRIYALPKKGDITADAVKGAVYRCGGQYALPFPAKEDSDKPQ